LGGKKKGPAPQKSEERENPIEVRPRKGPTVQGKGRRPARTKKKIVLDGKGNSIVREREEKRGIRGRGKRRHPRKTSRRLPT